MPALTIGRLAEQAGVNIDTIRYYERSGLLPAPKRRASGYREYGDGDIRRLQFIRRAKRLGFTLDEIEQLLQLSQGRDMGAVRAAARGKLADVEQRLQSLQRVRDALAILIDDCPGHGDPASCPIVLALSAETHGDD